MSDVDAYAWQLGQPPPIIYLHSLAKHRVIEAYLERYVEVLASDPRMDVLRFDVVDGMCGGGRYIREDNAEEADGSPLIFLRSLKAAEAKLNILRRKNFRVEVRFYFVDQSQRNIEYLQDVIRKSEFSNLLDEKIFTIVDSFEEKAADIINSIKNRLPAGRSIFLLDQYGYRDAPFCLIRSILERLPKAEILLTFGTDALIQFLNDSPSYRKTLSDIGVPAEDLSDMIELRKLKAWRYFVQARLSQSLQLQSGARFFTPFFIKSKRSNRAYWFIHLSQEVKARDEMVQVHWDHHTNFVHYGGAGLNMLGYDPSLDSDITFQDSFDFDENAEHSSLRALSEQLPKLIFQNRDGLQYLDLIIRTANGTPATQVLFKESLQYLKDEGEIEVLTSSGNERRNIQRAGKGDLIIPKSQMRFDFKPHK